MLVLHLTPVFAARGIEKPFSFLIKSGFTYHAAHVLSNGATRVLRLDHVEKLCLILRCEPNDIIRFIPSANQVVEENHPLQKLKFSQSEQTYKDIISKMSFQEIQDLLATKTSPPSEENAAEPPTAPQ